MRRKSAVALLDRLHSAQNEFYAGGSADPLEELLDPEVSWTVPGQSRISGHYRGREEVLEYFRRRRELADRTFRLVRREVLVGEGSRVAALTDGAASIRGIERRWSTVGLYEIADGRIAACLLLPLDPGAFDAIWSV
jgi:ketosteroid isomerase-like protein